MAIQFKAGLLSFGMTVLLAGGASAQGVSPAVNSVVDGCVRDAHISGTYFVRPVIAAGSTTMTVIPGGGVSAAQSQQINACIAQSAQGTASKPARTVRRSRPSDVAGCLEQYKAKLRATRGGIDYRGDNAGTRLFSGIFGRSIGLRLLENEYDRCLNNILAYAERCPNGVFSNGAGYCIKRPTR